MITYRHGSKDSLDIDIFYVFDKMPSFRECQEFCSDINENRNIIVINDSVVTDCFKGTVEEINNGLLDTYGLHEQQFENLVTKRLERDILIKHIRVVRCLVSHFSRTQYRTDVKKALKSFSWKERLELLSNIDIKSIYDYGKNHNKTDIYKVFAFQLGQSLSLIDGVEVYTKMDIANRYPDLRQFLYREDKVDLTVLENYILKFLDEMKKLEVEEHENFVYFKDFNKKFDLKKETYL